MKYNIQRALVFNEEVFNLGNWIVINNKVLAKLKNIYFVDEYNAKIVTTEGDFLLDDIETMTKINFDFEENINPIIKWLIMLDMYIRNNK